MRPMNYQANKYIILEVTFNTFTSDLRFHPRLLANIASTITPITAAIPQIKFTSTSTYVDAQFMDNDGIYILQIKF